MQNNVPPTEAAYFSTLDAPSGVAEVLRGAVFLRFLVVGQLIVAGLLTGKRPVRGAY